MPKYAPISLRQPRPIAVELKFHQKYCYVYVNLRRAPLYYDIYLVTFRYSNMKPLLDFVPLIIFFYLYKTVDPNDTDHQLLPLIGSAGGVANNHILVAPTGLLIARLVVYGALFVMRKFRLDK